MLAVFLISARAAELQPPIPIKFQLEKAGLVTLVIEDAAGVRVRNLISETPLPAGANTVWWDGLDDLGRDPEAAAHAVFHIPGKLVSPGKYRVHGLVRSDIDLVYEFTTYNEGQPPWKTAAHSSLWLADHTPPSAVLFVPDGQAPLRAAGPAVGGQVLVGSYVAEGGDGLVWLDLEGHKLFGQKWIGGVWTGASHLTRDVGPNADPAVYAYTGAWWKGDKYNDNKEELRLFTLLKQPDESKAPHDKRFGYGENEPVLPATYKLGQVSEEGGARTGLGGLAIYNGLLVASLPKSDELLFINARDHKVIGTTPLADARGLAFDRHGNLLVLAGDQLLAFRLGPNPLQLPASQLVVTNGLDDPQQITVDDQDRIYISDRGASHQVKVFTSQGRFLHAIGAAGKPAVGPYNPAKMHNPTGITVDGRGRLWVAEADNSPKRVSVWTLDGQFVRAYYGPPQYGGGGVIDPLDKTRYFYGGMEFKLDWDNGTSRPVAILYRSDVNPFAAGRSGPPEWPVHLAGRDYLVNCYNSAPTSGSHNLMVWALRAGIAVPVAAVGSVQDWEQFQQTGPFSARWEGPLTTAAAGEYTFKTTCSGVRLWIDGRSVINNWKGSASKSTGKFPLEAGKEHVLRLEYIHHPAAGVLRLEWALGKDKPQLIPAKQFPTGLRTEFFRDNNLHEPVTNRTSAAISFDWDKQPPFAQAENPFRAKLPVGEKSVVFAWSDLNDDGQMQPDEVTFTAAKAGPTAMMRDGSVVTSAGLLLKLEGFTTSGVPRYDATKATRLVADTQSPTSSGGGEALLCSNGWFVLTTAPKPFAPQGVGGAQAGQAQWSYPSLWPGLHASHNAAVVDQPGVLLGTTRLLGWPVTPRGSDAGDIWAINGNFGNIYLMTGDGLFVATLFKDCRHAAWDFPAATRGMKVGEASLGAENFWPSITQTADGAIYLVATHNCIVRVTGLESVRRLPPQELAVTTDQLAAARDYFVRQEADRQTDQGPRKLTIPLRTTPLTVDGDLSDWPKTGWVTLDERTIQVGDWGHQKFKTEAALCVAGDRLGVALTTDDGKALQNSAESPVNLFKTGGAIDLMIGADPAANPARKTPVPGDCRLLVAQTKAGKTIAVLYRAVVPGFAGEKIPFTSPLRTVTFDEVRDVSDQVTLAVRLHMDDKLKRELPAIELSVPLSLLGVKAVAGQSIRGDIGVLRGNGFETMQRVYWSNKATGLTSDLPSEAELTPALWGTWEFRTNP